MRERCAAHKMGDPRETEGPEATSYAGKNMKQMASYAEQWNGLCTLVSPRSLFWWKEKRNGGTVMYDDAEGRLRIGCRERDGLTSGGMDAEQQSSEKMKGRAKE